VEIGDGDVGASSGICDGAQQRLIALSVALQPTAEGVTVTVAP
jgi:hypothetical protein